MTGSQTPNHAAELEDALHVVVAALVRAIGLPPAIPGGQRVWVRGIAPLVDPDRVPAGPYALACKILEATGLALVALDEQPGLVSVEEGLAYLTGTEVSPC